MARAVGFTTGSVRRLIWTEHALLFGLGIAGGTLAAGLALFPTMQKAESEVALGPMTLLVAGIAASSALWTGLAGRAATRGSLLAALREE